MEKRREERKEKEAGMIREGLVIFLSFNSDSDCALRLAVLGGGHSHVRDELCHRL